MEKNPTKINLGGGSNRVEGFTNIDIMNLPEVDIVHDINTGLPLTDNSVDEIMANHVLEHLPDTANIMKEIFRVSKNGAIIKIKVPYFKSIGAFKDPTHVSFFTEKTFDYFDQEKLNAKAVPDYGYGVNFKVKKIAYLWGAEWLRYLPFKKAFFMKYFWNIVRTIYYELTVIK